jgi:hypothetical protein
LTAADTLLATEEVGEEGEVGEDEAAASAKTSSSSCTWSKVKGPNRTGHESRARGTLESKRVRWIRICAGKLKGA